MKHKKLIVEDVSITERVEDFPLPPPKLHSRFENIEDWLIDIFTKDKPKKPISRYEFALVSSAGDYVLLFAGLNKHGNDTKIEFEPLNMFFPLPMNYYNNLNRNQVADKLIMQIKCFTMTEAFKTSYCCNLHSLFFDGRLIFP